MIKFEGESGIDLNWLLGELQKEFGIKTKKQIKKLFVEACCRNVVSNEIADMIRYILENERGEE